MKPTMEFPRTTKRIRRGLAIVALAGSVGACTASTPQPGETQSPSASAPSPTVSIEETKAKVEAVVKRYFAALRDTNYEDRAKLSTGPVRAVAKFFVLALADAKPFRGFLTKTLQVRELTDDSAVVDFLGVLKSGKTGTTRYTDVRVEKVKRQWKVADYRLDGTLISERFLSLKGSASSEGMTIKFMGAYATDVGFSVFLRVRNANAEKFSFMSDSDLVVNGRGYTDTGASGDITGESVSYVDWGVAHDVGKVKTVDMHLSLHSFDGGGDIVIDKSFKL